MRRPGPTKEWRSASAAGKLECARELVRPTGEENADGQVYGIGRARVKLHVGGGGSEREAAEIAGRGDERPSADRGGAGRGGAAASVSGGGNAVGWLYEMLEPYVPDLVVVGVSEGRGQKNDKLDAFGLAKQYGACSGRARGAVAGGGASPGGAPASVADVPGLGPVRTAELLPVVVTPYRFQSRGKFWALWAGGGDADVVGRGANPKWTVGEGGGAADAGSSTTRCADGSRAWATTPRSRRSAASTRT
jgi:hypothetical protein